MRVIEENETELYIELSDSDLPYSMPSVGKNIYVRFKSEEPSIDRFMPSVWKNRDELLEIYPDE